MKKVKTHKHLWKWLRKVVGGNNVSYQQADMFYCTKCLKTKTI